MFYGNKVVIFTLIIKNLISHKHYSVHTIKLNQQESRRSATLFRLKYHPDFVGTVDRSGNVGDTKVLWSSLNGPTYRTQLTTTKQLPPLLKYLSFPFVNSIRWRGATPRSRYAGFCRAKIILQSEPVLAQIAHVGPTMCLIPRSVTITSRETNPSSTEDFLNGD